MRLLKAQKYYLCFLERLCVRPSDSLTSIAHPLSPSCLALASASSFCPSLGLRLSSYLTSHLLPRAGLVPLVPLRTPVHSSRPAIARTWTAACTQTCRRNNRAGVGATGQISRVRVTY